MGATKEIIVNGFGSTSHAPTWMTINSRVASGPAGTEHRAVTVRLDVSNLATLVSALAGRPDCLDAMRAVIAESDRRAAICTDPDVRPNAYMANRPDSIQTINALHHAARKALGLNSLNYVTVRD